MIRGVLQLLSLLTLVLAMSSCPQATPEPIEIVLDEDSCVVCRMAVSQQRFAAEIVKTDGTALYFDDIGCLVEYARSPGVPDGAAAFVVDFETSEWLKAESAAYLYAKTLPTPMSYGLGAFATADGAQQALAEWPGDVLTWSTVLKEWKP